MTRNNQSGYVLVVVISILSILVVVGMAFAGFTLYGLQRTASVSDSLQAYYAAKAGIANALQTASTQGSQGTTETDLKYFSQSSSASVQIKAMVSWQPAPNNLPIGSGGNAIEIVSRGIVETKSGIRGERIVQAIADPATQKIYYLTELPVQTKLTNKKGNK